MTHQEQTSILEDVLKELTLREPEGLKHVITILMNAAMKIEREHALKAAPYERSEERTGYSNGYKDKTTSTRLGKIEVKVPQVRDEVEFYPQSLEKGIRSECALKLAIAEMYVKGVSTRKVSTVVEQLCGTSISSAQFSAASKILDDEIAVWRNRPLGQYQYLMLDARYEHVRQAGSVASCAVLIACGISYEGRREVLGVSACMSEAEVHWRGFLESLIRRGLHGLTMIISDAHCGLGKARGEVLVGLLPSNRKKGIDNPTTERLLKVFEGVTLTVVRIQGQELWHVTPLTDVQMKILDLLGLAPAVYHGLAENPG